MPLLGLVMLGTSTKPVGVALSSVKHWDPGSVAFPGFTGACKPPPVQFLTAAALAITQVRVRLEPHSLADCAHSSQADMELTPRDLGLAPPTYWLSKSMYFCTAGTWLASSKGTT